MNILSKGRLLFSLAFPDRFYILSFSRLAFSLFGTAFRLVDGDGGVLDDFGAG